MPTGIDHIVIAVNDLDTASGAFAKAGFTVVPGGDHVTTGTHNVLIPFRDGSYLELIAVKDAELASSHPWFIAMKGQEGLVTFAVRSKPIEAEVDRLRTAGLEVPEIRDGSRLRLDGEQLAWKSAQPVSDPPTPLPFLIEDVTPREMRVPAGDEAKHENGVIGTTGVTLVLKDLKSGLRPFGEMFSAPVAALDHGYEGVQQSWRYFTEEYWIDLIEAPEDDSELASYHRARGDALYQIYLTVETGPEFPAGRLEIEGFPQLHIMTSD